MNAPPNSGASANEVLFDPRCVQSRRDSESGLVRQTNDSLADTTNLNPLLSSQRNLIMKSLKNLLLTKSIIAAAIAAGGIAAPAVGHAVAVGGPASGMACR
ncbi:MAG TPA: hypothetical protein VF107_10210, partial [Burkholderiaceae bacterium]